MTHNSDGSSHTHSSYLMPIMFTLVGHVQAMPLIASATGALVQELPLSKVMPTAVETGILADGKLDFVIVTVDEDTSIQVKKFSPRI